MHTATPTDESYLQFQAAYKHFNETLFMSQLPAVLLTLVNKPNSKGYFHEAHFAADCGARTDELSLNPSLFKARSDRQTLSTLVHEMAHVWQAHFGKPGRAGYHNAQWAAEMDRVGLCPSSTGAPGGKRTGQKMTHYIVDGGPFDRSCAALLATGFAIRWGMMPAAPKESKSGKRTKYVCDGCEAQVWGKDGLNIGCLDCGELMVVQAP